MKIKAMYIFSSIQEFFVFTEFLEECNWKIEKQLLKDRVISLREWPYFIKFKNQFYNHKISIWELKEEEIITWFDTLYLFRRVFTCIVKKGIVSNNLDIIMEYPLINGNYTRVDYLIIYDRLIFVLEFGMFNQDEKRSEERFTKKLQESINYRQIIANQVSKELLVTNYVMIYRPEYDRIKRLNIEENVIYNNTEVLRLSKCILNYIEGQQNLSAKKQLEFIEITNY